MGSPSSQPPTSPQPPAPSGTENIEGQISKLFIGPNGIRAGWRFLIFIAILFVCAGFLTVGWLFIILGPKGMAAGTAHLTMTASHSAESEAIMVFSMFVAVFIMSKIEKRPLGDYGLPRREAFGRHFWQGALWGIVAISVTLGIIAALHGLSFGALSLSASSLVGYALLWGLAFVLTGFFEEFTFRGYSQFTLTTGMGFWPSAILLSLMFGGLHLGNKGEAMVGALSAGLIGFFFCFTLWRTGTIWFAVGLHAAWDFGETFLYGTPDSGLVAPGHLFNSSFHGPRWVTGGTVGPEGSIACFIVIALLFLIFNFAYPRRAQSSPSS